jgi:hypothetical protein
VTSTGATLRRSVQRSSPQSRLDGIEKALQKINMANARQAWTLSPSQWNYVVAEFEQRRERNDARGGSETNGAPT